MFVSNSSAVPLVLTLDPTRICQTEEMGVLRWVDE